MHAVATLYVGSCHSQVRDIFPHITSRDLPCHRTKKILLLHQVSHKLWSVVSWLQQKSWIRTYLCKLWELLCAGFRHSAGLRARVILDGATCRLRECAWCTGCSRSCSGCTDGAACFSVIEGRANEEVEVLVVRSKWDNQGWDMENTRWLDSFQEHQDDNAILKPSAMCGRSVLVNKLYCTDVYCEWLTCLHTPRRFSGLPSMKPKKSPSFIRWRGIQWAPTRLP